MNARPHAPFLYIGYPKAASTFLGRYLDRHPDVAVSRIRLNHLNTRSVSDVAPAGDESAPAGKTDVKVNEKIAESICVVGDSRLWHRYKFVPDSLPMLKEHVVLDSHEAARRLKQAYPSARVFFTLREQVDWLHSSYKFFMPQLPAGQRSFADYCRTPRGIAYLQAGHYDRTIEAYAETFGSERVLVLQFDDIRKDPRQFLSRLCGFLGIAERALPTERANEGSTPQAARIRQLMPFVDRLPQPIKKLGKALLPFLPAGGESVLSDKETAAIREIYAESNRRTEKLLAGLAR
jgi:hypothetical protein